MARGSYSSTGGSNNQPVVGKKELFEMLGTSLLQQAVEPNMRNYKPHDKQQAFHGSTAKGKLFLGGNRSGKTVAGIVEDLWWATKRHPYRRIPYETAIRGRVIGDGFIKGTVNEVLIPAMKRWVIPSDLKNGSWEDSFNKIDYVLTFANGSFIEFKSYEQDLQKHAGTSRHFIHFDEEPPEAIYIENMMRLVDTAGSWWMTMTPLNGMNWVYDELYVKGMEGKLKNFFIEEVSSTDNPFIDKESLDTLSQIMDEDEADQRKYGKFAEKGGLIFPEFSEMHLLGEDYDIWMPPPDWRVYMSLDHGLNNPTAALWHAVSTRGEVITFMEHYKRNMLVKEHAERIKELEFMNKLNVWARPADPAMKQRNAVTGTSIVQEYAINGVFLTVDTIPRDVKTGLDRMKMYMRPTPTASGSPGPPRWRIIKSRCPDLIKEMKRLHWKTYASSKLNDSTNKREEVHKKDDHAFDSSRYFFTMMPDLSPEEIWHLDDNKEIRLKTFTETLVDMANMTSDDAFNSFGMVPAQAQPSSRFAPSEYEFSGLEYD